MLKLQGVQKHYGSFLALEVPDLFINEGIWWVQGENGSGKTTLLKIIAGMHPFTGNITLCNTLSLKKQRQKFLRLVNYAEAEPLYPDFLTAEDLVRLYCKTKEGDFLQAQDLLKKLHVFDAYKQKLGSYSSGMIKKVSLVLAFIGKPKVILLDEPLITVDAHTVDNICNIINAYYKKGVSFIITSHQAVSTDVINFTGRLEVEDRTVKVQTFTRQP